MRHLNFAHLAFTKTGLTRHIRGGGEAGEVPPWSFYLSMEHSGHNVGKFFVVPVPKSVVPVATGEKTYGAPYADYTEQPVYILPENSFNVVAPFRIITPAASQSGTLIFGLTTVEYDTTIVEGEQFILLSERNNFRQDKTFVFAAVLREGQRIVFYTKVWVKSNNPSDWGKQDKAVVFTANGKYATTWKDYELHGVREDTTENIKSGKWRLV